MITNLHIDTIRIEKIFPLFHIVFFFRSSISFIAKCVKSMMKSANATKLQRGRKKKKEAGVSLKKNGTKTEADSYKTECKKYKI